MSDFPPALSAMQSALAIASPAVAGQLSPLADLRMVPRTSISIRVATLDDLPAIDALQKAESKSVGFLPRMALTGKIHAGEILVADGPQADPALAGYLIASDRYFKRDEVGLITAMNIAPAFRRSLVAAALLEAQFARSAYGCRLYCCWCAQDLEPANRFWEAMGFTPIAYRTGSETRGKQKSARTHLFWQKRIRENDRTTPWWYPGHTAGGALRADRPVFPLPIGARWFDELPDLLPAEEPAQSDDATPAQDRPRKARTRGRPPAETNDLVPGVNGVMPRRASDSIVPPPRSPMPILPPRGVPAWVRRLMMAEYEIQKRNAEAIAAQRAAELERAKTQPERAKAKPERAKAQAPSRATGDGIATASDPGTASQDDKPQASGLAPSTPQQRRRTKLSPQAKQTVRALRDHWGERIAPLLANAPAKHDICRRELPARSAGSEPLAYSASRAIGQSDAIIEQAA